MQHITPPSPAQTSALGFRRSQIQQIDTTMRFNRIERVTDLHYSGELTLDQLIAELASVRLDVAGWTHAGSALPSHTVAAYARLITYEQETNR